ncbi:hypothetical protein AC477_05235 [miscellaneous Crenarchaeota group-1 archaeon SG8-32-1]|uniref:FHA domain-containing protein n=1 Tax=miscellaneous Crenarchaeota group-1 archaeon SG8-32-1 TaxID=1685124 RepID=A0A0M0BNF3_9ARCH|nr:MAG: hypothetical protein AC477_05235 [miscellaneous Crenarchaeota group-1 archaeon SG8-32-1]
MQKLGGVQEIIKMHLDPVMKNFSLEECDICSEMFRYLVTPSGTKIAHKISDLASYAGIEKGKMAPVVLKLGSKSILREIPPPLGLNENRYEIYHDILGRAILDWQARFKTYKEWLSKRPWGYGRVLSSGNILELKGSTVSFGRWWPNGLTEFDRNKYLSRMHMFITFVKEENAFYAVDLRSKNGTTINAKCLCYGEEKKLQEGDIIVLAGTTPFQLWCINYLQKERFKVEKEFPFNQKDKGHIKEPHGWAVLVNGTTRIYDYIESDLCYLSKLPTGDIRISEKMQFEPFLILRRISKELAEFEFCDKKHALKFSSKTENKDFPIEFTMKYGESKFLNGTFAFKYRNVHFQIVPL